MVIEINSEAIGAITAEEYLALDEKQQSYVVSIMTEMQRRLLKVRLTTYESRRIQRNFQNKRKSCLNWEPIRNEECIGAFKIDENYVLSGNSPFEISRRIRELGCKRTFQAYSKGDNSMETLKSFRNTIETRRA